MKKHKIKKDKELFRIKNKIQQIASCVNDVDIEINTTDNGKFESLIRVHIPPKKNLIAIKRDERWKVSLEKSRQAIMRQVKKIKEKRNYKKIEHFAQEAT